MPRWKYTVNVKQFLSENDSDEEVVRIRGLVATELEKAPPFRESFDDAEGADAIYDLKRAENAQEFNDSLERIYEHADTYRVWLGI